MFRPTQASLPLISIPAQPQAISQTNPKHPHLDKPGLFREQASINRQVRRGNPGRAEANNAGPACQSHCIPHTSNEYLQRRAVEHKGRPCWKQPTSGAVHCCRHCCFSGSGDKSRACLATNHKHASPNTQAGCSGQRVVAQAAIATWNSAISCCWPSSMLQQTFYVCFLEVNSRCLSCWAGSCSDPGTCYIQHLHPLFCARVLTVHAPAEAHPPALIRSLGALRGVWLPPGLKIGECMVRGLYGPWKRRLASGNTWQLD